MNYLHTTEQIRKVFWELAAEYGSCGLVTHKNPDGDGLCSCLALQELLGNRARQNTALLGYNFNQENKYSNIPVNTTDAHIILEEDAPDNFDFLDAKQRTVVYHDKMSYPLLIIVDCQTPDRLGKCRPLIGKAETVLIIDHHEPPHYSPDNSPEGLPFSSSAQDDNPGRQAAILPSYSYIYNDPRWVSVGAIIFRTFGREITKLSSTRKKYIAGNIYVTILNDTNNFTNSNTDEEVFRLCSELVSLKMRPDIITAKIRPSRTPSYYRFLGLTFSTLKSYENEAIVFLHSTLQMLAENNLGSEATSKMTDNLKNLSDNTKVVVYFREIARDLYSLSLRSNAVNIQKIATRYGGGGHKKASGCEIAGGLQAIQKQVLKDIKDLLYDK